MARGLNRAQIIGNLGQDPELRYTGSGTAVCNLRVATNESYTDRDGETVQKTEWHTVVAWEGLAEVCAEHLEKGSQVYVEGKMETREWTDRDDNERQKTQIRASEVMFLDASRQQVEARQSGKKGSEEETFEPDDQLPF
jgi:single-strand DNA-binding protein